MVCSVRTSALLTLAAIATSGCATPSPQIEIVTPPSGANFRQALDRAISDPTAERLRIWVRTWVDDGFVEAEVFGRGVGIWNRERSFAIPRADVSELLGRAKSARVASMPAHFGGHTKPAEGPEPRTAGEGTIEGGPVRLVREIQLSIGVLDKRVEQRNEGEQSETLRDLIEAVLAKAHELKSTGESANTLEDGLDKLARGLLPPEAMKLSFHDKPELGDAERTGLLLHLRGREAEVREFTKGEGYAAPVTLVLSKSEFEMLARSLRERSPGRFPINLYAARYVDLTLEVLNHRVSTQARRFAGMDRRTHGDVQSDFDAVRETVLHLPAAR